MAVVTFDPTAFKVRYPEFTAIPAKTLDAVFYDATLYLSNSDDSPVQDITRRASLLNMLVAHIVTISGIARAYSNNDASGASPSPLGRLSSATEGSVSVSYDFQQPASPSAAWFTQTQYGFAFWQGTSNLRSLRYIPCPARY